jgi:hypothetical protein
LRRGKFRRLYRHAFGITRRGFDERDFLDLALADRNALVAQAAAGRRTLRSKLPTNLL